MSQIGGDDTPGQSPHADHERRTTPLPWTQFSILLLLRASEAITLHVSTPFLPQLIRDIGITDGNDSRVGYYVGLMNLSSYLTEACAIFYWNRLSDRIGRKPILLIGLFGQLLSMWFFGLSKTFWTLIFSQCLHRALDGNIGTVKSIVIEITDPTNIALAYGILPMAAALGSTIGSLIGGSLARPAERFPKIFGDSIFLKEYPYFLPCVVSATVTALSWLISYTFLKETTKPQLSLGQYLFGQSVKTHAYVSDPQVTERLLPDDPSEGTQEQLSIRSILTRPVQIAIGSYVTLSLADIGIRAITPVYYAMSIEMGGLDLGPPTIGFILALFGIPGAIIQWMFFAPMHDCLGAKATFLITVCLYLPVTVLFPVTNAVARVYGMNTFVWFLVGLQRLLLKFGNFAFEIAIMYIGAAAPNKSSLGATNGLAQTIVSLVRAIGAITVNSALSLSIERNIMGGYLPYWVMTVMIGLTLRVGYMLPRHMWKE